MRDRAKGRDRAVAAGAAGLLGAALLLAVAFSPSAEVPASAADDRGTAAELVALMRRGEAATYVGEYGFTRVTATGERLPSTEYLARRGRSFLRRTGDSLTIDYPDQSYDCARAGTTATCYVRNATRRLPDSEVVRVALADGVYGVTPMAATTIAGEAARCFRIRPRPGRGALAGFGAQSDLCFAADGVPLRNWRLTDHLDELEATAVTRRFDAVSLQPVFAGFEEAAPPRPR